MWLVLRSHPQAVCKGLEQLLWRLYAGTKSKSENHIFLVADPAAAATREKVVLCHAPNGMELPFVGPVSLNKTPQSLLLLQWGGVEFFVNPPPSPPAGDVVVPAWLAKHAGPKEHSTVELKSEDIMIYISNHGGVSMTKPKNSPPAMHSIGTQAKLPAATQVTQQTTQAGQEGTKDGQEGLDKATPATPIPAAAATDPTKVTSSKKQGDVEVVDLEDDATVTAATAPSNESNAKLPVPVKKEKQQDIKAVNSGPDLCDEERESIMFADERTPAAFLDPENPEKKEIWTETDITVYWLRVLNLSVRHCMCA